MGKKKRGPKYSPFSKEFYMFYKNMNEKDAIIEAKSKRPTNIEYWLKKGYNENEAKRKLSEYQSCSSKERSKKKRENPEKYNDIYPTQLKYWLKKGYNENEAKRKLSERQSTNSIKNIIKRVNCTLEEAKDIRDKITYKWLNTLSEKSIDEIKLINHKKIVTKDNFNSYNDWKAYCMSKANTLENFIRRYGDKLGNEKYRVYHKNQKGRYTLKWYIEKYGEKLGKEKYNYKLKKWHIKYGNVSKESKKFFIPLYKELRKIGFKKSDILFGIKGSKELCLIDTDNKHFYYDFTILPLNIIIEYHGVAFHPNPKWLKNDIKKWDNWKHPFEHYNSDIKFHIDLYKREVAENNNYSVYEIWSDDDKITSRNKILNEIKNKNN